VRIMTDALPQIDQVSSAVSAPVRTPLEASRRQRDGWSPVFLDAREMKTRASNLRVRLRPAQRWQGDSARAQARLEPVVEPVAVARPQAACTVPRLAPAPVNSAFDMKRGSSLSFVVCALVALPQEASANAGTPLMWAGMIHLVIGNALVGLLEGLLLAWWFRVPRAKAVGAMIVANHISAWLGGLFIRGAIVRALPMDLTNGWQWFWIMVVVTYFLTLVLEWPLVASGVRGAQAWLMRSVRASLLIQSSSYILLFGWYWMASGTSLYTMMHVVTAKDLDRIARSNR